MTTDDWLKRGIDVAWLVLVLWWLVSAWGNKSAARGEPWLTRVFLYWIPLVVAFVLLGPGDWFGHTLLREGIVPHTVPVFAVAFVTVEMGVRPRVLVAISARPQLEQRGPDQTGS